MSRVCRKVGFSGEACSLVLRNMDLPAIKVGFARDLLRLCCPAQDITSLLQGLVLPLSRKHVDHRCGMHLMTQAVRRVTTTLEA